MQVQFAIPVEFDEEVKENDTKNGVSLFITDTINHLRALPGKFGQLPFNKCVIVEGLCNNIRHGQQINLNDLDKSIEEWFWQVIQLAKTEIHYKQQEDCGCIIVQLSDDGMTFGFRIRAYAENSNQMYHFTVLPHTDDVCADKQEPWLFRLFLNGDQRK